ncbi:hypothetical protein C3747_88g195 [Trypanosoma cruzi]|uniref:Uncharacterized protein n=2 Tax=Trypanosoma cruzi TaxID=5693 RepID=Q4DGJ4_TRYCC|nr:hypothetical protein, conserved [Trypanosoma cruzi]EAN91645.1 hypothetical protein, conserved [Trypanosoma cruzi]PWV08606.1 hypothetical protein C3747_88g195 [Trypanosoma cruzi]RNC57243.1 hypothetical protein TcCL_ESM05162 [Trypanosoma cruzi]|eukprot:XP_813496.1 hypothetical protein [Trypanosoma cruzi strain CL Brener]
MRERVKNDWGEMVLPGVYMLRGSTTSSRGRTFDLDASKLQLELILNEIEVMERHVKKLKESNSEIKEYLKNHGDSIMESTNTISTSGAVAAVIDTEDINDVLAEALVENETIISRKEMELNELKQLIQSNRCACSYHSIKENNEGHSVPDDTSRNSVATEVQGVIDEMSNTHFSL